MNERDGFELLLALTRAALGQQDHAELIRYLADLDDAAACALIAFFFGGLALGDAGGH